MATRWLIVSHKKDKLSTNTVSPPPAVGQFESKVTKLRASAAKEESVTISWEPTSRSAAYILQTYLGDKLVKALTVMKKTTATVYGLEEATEYVVKGE